MTTISQLHPTQNADQSMQNQAMYICRSLYISYDFMGHLRKFEDTGNIDTTIAPHATEDRKTKREVILIVAKYILNYWSLHFNCHGLALEGNYVHGYMEFYSHLIHLQSHCSLMQAQHTTIFYILNLYFTFLLPFVSSHHNFELRLID